MDSTGMAGLHSGNNGFNGFNTGLSPIKPAESVDKPVEKSPVVKCSTPSSETSNPAKSPSSDTSETKPSVPGRFHPYGGGLPPQLFYDKTFLSPLAASLPFSPFAQLQTPYPLLASAYQQKLLFPQNYLPPQLTELYQKKAALVGQQTSPAAPSLAASPAHAPEQDSPIDLSTRAGDVARTAVGSDDESDAASVRSAASSRASTLDGSGSDMAAGATQPALPEAPLDLTART